MSDRNPYRRCFSTQGGEGSVCRSAIWAGRYPIVYVATPPAETQKYLPQLARCPSRFIAAIEKPWWMSLAAAEEIKPLIERSSVAFTFIDHYLARESVRFASQLPLEHHLGGPIVKVAGRLFQRSGLESQAMRVGVLRDVCIHLVSATLRLLGGPIAVTHAFAGRHDEWDSPSESYIQVQGQIRTGHYVVPVDFEAAKDYPFASKLLYVHGRGGTTLRIDFATDTVDLLYQDGSCKRLHPPQGEANYKPVHPYLYVLTRLVEKNDPSVGLTLDEALTVTRFLGAAQRLFPSPLPRYKKGDYPPDRK